MSALLSAWNKSAPTGWIQYLRMFLKSAKKFQVLLKFDSTIRYITWRPVFTFRIIFRVRNVLDKSCRENQNTHIVCSITFSQRSPCLWDNVEKYGRARQATDDSIICRRHFACCITKATNTHSGVLVILLFQGNKGYGNAPQCYIICTLPFLLIQKWRGQAF
jgi:hypothetical protein